MKKKFIPFLMFFISFGIVFAQINMSPKELSTNKKQLHKIDAQPFLKETTDLMVDFLKENPLYFQQRALMKTKAFNFSVGDTKSWTASDVTKTGLDQFYQVPSTCRAVGQKCYVFVEDAVWNSRVTQSAVDKIVDAFDNKTPTNDSQGIYEIDVETFGTPPNVDGDDKIVILILDIKDGYEAGSNGGFVAGYFHGYHEGLKINGFTHSNEAEIYFMDANPADLLSDNGMNNSLNTAAHEFQHMIHFAYDQNEVTFINEGCSEIASYICGYGLRSHSLYLSDPNVDLLSWDKNADGNKLPDYARANRLFLYLYEKYGKTFLKNLVANSLNSSEGLNAALSSVGASESYTDVMTNFMIANYINNKEINSMYGYDIDNIELVNPPNYLTAGATKELNISNLAAEYMSYEKIKDFKITFTPTQSTNSVKLYSVKFSGNNVTLSEESLSTELSYPELGTAYDKVGFIVINKSPVLNYNVSAVTSGQNESNIVEIKHDVNPALGSLNLNEGDKTLVTFDKVAGASLDSVKIALREVGNLNFEMFEFTGGTTTIGFGEDYGDFTAVSTKNAEKVGNSWQDPFDNWVKVDLTSKNLTADKNFCVLIPHVSSAPRLMVGEKAGTSADHNFNFISSSNQWTFYGVSGKDAIWIYMVRAYVSFEHTGVKEIVELTPTSYQLEQNYPNPFNPSTTFNYSITEDTDVTINIFDIMGRKIKTLVDENQTSGTYQVTWDGKNDQGVSVSSGIYFYRIKAGDFVQTRKMSLLK